MINDMSPFYWISSERGTYHLSCGELIKEQYTYLLSNSIILSTSLAECFAAAVSNVG